MGEFSAPAHTTYASWFSFPVLGFIARLERESERWGNSGRGKAAMSEAAEVKFDIMRKLHTWLRAAKRKPPTTASSPGWKVDEGGWAVGAGRSHLVSRHVRIKVFAP